MYLRSRMLIEHYMTRVIPDSHHSTLIAPADSCDHVTGFRRPDSNVFPVEETVATGPGQITKNLSFCYKSTKRGRHHQNFSVRIIGLNWRNYSRVLKKSNN